MPVSVDLRKSPGDWEQAETKPLDEKEAPQREAARIASADEAEKAKLEKARLANKPKFRP
jgi:hypothetical protein